MLHEFKNILVAVPAGSEDQNLLSRAAEIAQANKGKLTLMDVVELPLPPKEINVVGGEKITAAKWLKFQKMLLQARERELQELAEKATRRNPVPLSVKVVQGNFSVEITRDIVTKKRDLLMKSATPEKGTIERLLGGLDTQLIRRCPCPVWIGKPRQTKQYKRILVALDPDPDDEVRDSLNLTLLELATSLAGKIRAELFVVHAWEMKGESILRYGEMQIGREEMEAMIRHEKTRRKHALDNLLARHPEQDFKRHVMMTKGDARRVIPKIAQKKKIDLVIMGTVCRTGLKGFFIGNTAEAMLHQLQCAVLTVKPEGFQTPLDI